MRLFFFAFFCIPVSLIAQSFSGYLENSSPDYPELKRLWTEITGKDSRFTTHDFGMTDAGYPLKIIVFHPVLRPDSLPVLKTDSLPKVLVINGIHPGEPDGINASLEWALRVKNGVVNPGNVCWIFITVYNVDGMLNRGCCSRVNQEGPAAYGFRGNAQNLDLNRDFIKQDSYNAASYARLFTLLSPDVLIDNHVSNGADYPYTFTLIPTWDGKLARPLADFLNTEMLPELKNSMGEKGWDVAPYVNTVQEIPDSGLVAFLETPRFSTGYAALFHTLGFTVETHMLKPFPDRVASTLDFMISVTDYVQAHGEKIQAARNRAFQWAKNTSVFPVNWQLDKTQKDSVWFSGYEAEYPVSSITGKPHLQYNRNKPFQKWIPYYRSYTATVETTKPAAYIFSFAYARVAERLQRAGVQLEMVEYVDSVELSGFTIQDVSSVSQPYEGHYLHKAVQVRDTIFRDVPKGKYYQVRLGTSLDYFICSVLDPRAVDGYFAWNFFDGILQQKEWFSDYVWEDKAVELLAKDADLYRKFQQARQADENLASDTFSQLYWIYRHSPYFEKTVKRYPVYGVY